MGGSVPPCAISRRTDMAHFVDGNAVLRAGGDLRSIFVRVLMVTALAGCSSGSDDSSSPAAAAGRGGSGAAGESGAGGTGEAGASVGGSSATGGSVAAGTGGTMVSAGGTAGTGGSTAGSGGSMSGGATGMQPLGAICSFDEQCSQAEGVTVCCENACTLGEGCATSPLYLPCDATADCAAYGGGKLCCEVIAGGQTTRFCTKRSACSGQILE